MKRIQIHDKFNLSDQDLENVVGGLSAVPTDYNFCLFCTQCVNCDTCVNCDICISCHTSCAVCQSVVMM